MFRDRPSLMRYVLAVFVCVAVTAAPAAADDGEIEILPDFELGHVLAPGSRLLRPGVHAHDCGNDAVDVYVTERVPLDGGVSVASRRATLEAFRTLAAFAYGSVGSRQQEFSYVQTPGGTEEIGMLIRNRVRTAGVVNGLRPAARVVEGEALLMVFVLPLSGAVPAADCLPEGSAPRDEAPSVTTGVNDDTDEE